MCNENNFSYNFSDAHKTEKTKLNGQESFSFCPNTLCYFSSTVGFGIGEYSSHKPVSSRRFTNQISGCCHTSLSESPEDVLREHSWAMS